ncbi:YigZ family protein [Citreimonas sp.]|uniref:YigZ family protein n=1 Tax=Citreimonas sp. TaxID=3036715 RepID=UPI004059FD1D
MLVLENILSDRGSRYAAAGGPCRSEVEAKAFLKQLKRRKKFAKATHNSWACLSREHGPLWHDDGEAGAAAVILRMLEREKVQDEIVVVTRWFGGKHLGGDRFRHVQTVVRAYLDARGGKAG